MNLLWVTVTAFVIFNTVSPMRKRQRIYDMQMLSNSTRRDVLNDVVGFLAGAWAAESIIQIGNCIQAVQHEHTIADQLQLLNGTSDSS